MPKDGETLAGKESQTCSHTLQLQSFIILLRTLKRLLLVATCDEPLYTLFATRQETQRPHWSVFPV